MSFSQSTISFESSEGFTAGSMHGQGTWVTTGTGGTPANVTNQIISYLKSLIVDYYSDKKIPFENIDIFQIFVPTDK